MKGLMNQTVDTTSAHRHGWPILLYATVIVTGAAVMILELLGTRIIGPFYGVSLYVWSSLIAVTLIALALGYFLGGMFADRYTGVRLTHVILTAALAMAAIPFVSGPVMRLTDPLGLRAGAFVSALLLFTLPLTALAMVGPYVIKRATRDLRDVGTTSGTVYAISTVGSVAGTLLLGFYLLPTFGTRTIIYSLSIFLVSLAAVVALYEQRRSLSGAISPVIVAIMIFGATDAFGLASVHHQVPGFIVRFEAESLYGWVRVVDDERKGFRLLLSDASVISAVDIKENRSLLGYQEIMSFLPTILPQTTRTLLIGLGGGHVARNLKSKGIVTDTIEIDPAVADAARRFFHFEPTGSFLVGDARYEVTRLPHHYDLIIHDCFTGGAEPTHLLSREMLLDLHALLNDRGILTLNYVGFTRGEGADAVASVHRTLKSVFPNLRVFTTNKEEFTDFVFLASQEPLQIEEHGEDRRIRWLLDHEHSIDDSLGVTITDDYNPMESRQVRKSEIYRKHFLERIAFELLLR